MTELRLFRVYEPHELGADGYPLAWHRIPSNDLVGDLPAVEAEVGDYVGVKDVVRHLADYRCLRCGHPYRSGGGTYERGSTDAELLRHPTHDLLPLSLEAVDQLAPGAMARGILWSPCDEHCEHAGPVRVVEGGSSAGEFPEGPGALVAARATADAIDGHVEAAWRILTVHHLNGRKFDLRWWNLAALCQRCHLLVQRKVQMERLYPFEHSPWFRPFAAGWYAYAYLGEDLTRAQVAERLDELLGLERLA